MTNETVEQIKLRGSKEALRDHIHSLIFELNSRNFSNIQRGDRFYRLDEAMNDARMILGQMHAAFSALQELDPENF